MVVPCMVKSSLNVSALTTWPFGPASWSRITSASSPPTRKNANAVKP